MAQTDISGRHSRQELIVGRESHRDMTEADISGTCARQDLIVRHALHQRYDSKQISVENIQDELIVRHAFLQRYDSNRYQWKTFKTRVDCKTCSSPEIWLKQISVEDIQDKS